MDIRRVELHPAILRNNFDPKSLGIYIDIPKICLGSFMHDFEPAHQQHGPMISKYWNRRAQK